MDGGRSWQGCGRHVVSMWRGCGRAPPVLCTASSAAPPNNRGTEPQHTGARLQTRNGKYLYTRWMTSLNNLQARSAQQHSERHLRACTVPPTIPLESCPSPRPLTAAPGGGHRAGMHWKGGGGSMRSHCLPDGRCQLQWHLQLTVTAPNRFGNLLQPPVEALLEPPSRPPPNTPPHPHSRSAAGATCKTPLTDLDPPSPAVCHWLTASISVAPA